MASHPSRIGPYDIEREIGRGGMGVVYLARDARLDRAVAIKALPEEFASDAERLARFTREAKLLASLNHPNIAAIFGLEEIDAARYLVLEYVSGENLAERLARGALPVEEALAVCGQIAAGIEAAHEAGVIHRDLKPGNVILTDGGTAKVLDFGLARGGGDGADSASGLSHSPTMSLAATRAGVLLGTAAYMSPEQARGRGVDRRADVWSFGCVLFECLTGKTTFAGETVSDTIAAVLKSEPDWSALPRSTPRAVTRLIHRCLEKDARRRLRDIGDARFEIEEALASLRSGVRDEAPAAAAAENPPLLRRALPWAIAALASMVALVAVIRGGAPSGSGAALRAPACVAIPFPAQHPIDDGSNIESIAISPDGRRIAYVEDADATYGLAVRTLESFDVTSLTGTDFAANPFFSADGEWIAYYTGSSLSKIPVTGGAAVKICDMREETPGGAWGPDGTIVFAGGWSGGLMRIPAAGGEAKEFTRLDATRDEVSHRYPQFLPDGKHILFTVKTANMEQFDDALIQVCDIESGEAKVVIEGGSLARYMSDHIFYVRGGTLFAAPFDLGRLEVTGAARPVADNIITWPSSGAAWYAVSATGDLIYANGGERPGPTSLVWVDREGRESPITTEPRSYQSPLISPDGRRLACWVGAANDKLWLFDLERGTLSRLTSGAGNDREACWSPDGRRIAFRSDRAGPGDIFQISLEGGGGLDTLVKGHRDLPSSFSPDGAFLAFTRQDPKTGGDIWLLPLEGDRTSRPFIVSPFNEWEPKFSPDGQWLAFVSDESGVPEIYVTPYPGPVTKTQLSRGDGQAPRWSRESGELFYRTEDSLASVSPAAGATRFGTPRMLFSTRAYAFAFEGSYDVAAEGDRFVFAKADTSRVALTHLNLVLNWGAKPGR